MKKVFKVLSIFIFIILSMNKVNATEVPSIRYSTHVQDYGWLNAVSDGAMSGTTGESKRMEALKIDLLNAPNSVIMYKVHVQDYGWLNSVSDGAVSGTTGESKRLEAVQIALLGDIANYYDIYYRVHVQDYGWQGWKGQNEIAGTTGESKRLEAIEIKLVQKENVNIEEQTPEEVEETLSLNYKSYTSEIGWYEAVNNNEISGSENNGKAIQLFSMSLTNTTSISGNIMYSVYTENSSWIDYKSSNETIGKENENIEAIKIKLTDKLSENYDVYYRSYVTNLGWLPWTKNDGISGTKGYFYEIEAIQVNLVEKGKANIETSKDAYLETTNLIQYSTHVQDYGWMEYMNDGNISGTTGQSKRVEAFKIKLNTKSTSSIKYKAYVDRKGWMEDKSNDEIAGTTGLSRKLEAIQISLTGPIANYYDVYYRTHVSNIGWLGWTKNGETSGSIGSDTQIEAILITIVKKGSSAPGDTSTPYVTGYWSGNSYINCFGNKVTGFRLIDGIKYYFNQEGTLIGSNVKKVIDVSSWQGTIDWNTIKVSDDVDAVILRVGWGMSYTDDPGIDSQFDRNIKEVQRLNIPYSIYIYAYAQADYAARNEANFVMSMMQKYNIPKDTFVWYDAEINSIPLSTYQVVVPTFINHMHDNGYNNVGVYSSLNNFIASYGNLNDATIRSYPLWVAQYYKKIQYPGEYRGWQYASDGYVDGINTRVDVNMFY